MKLFLLLTVVLVSGCSTIANYYDSQDPCLQAVRNNTTAPEWCGAETQDPYPVIIVEDHWILY